MTNTIKVVVILMAAAMMLACGKVEKIYESSNYESLTNERGDVEMYSGGVLVKTYKGARIIYSDSDSFAMWIKTADGKTIYWQGEAHMVIE